MKRIILAILACFSISIASASATPLYKLNCWGGILTPDGIWNGEQHVIEFPVDLNKLRPGFAITMSLRASDVPEISTSIGQGGETFVASFGGSILYYIQRQGLGKASRILVSITHAEEPDIGRDLGQAVAAFPVDAKSIYLSQYLNAPVSQGLAGFTLNCNRER